jgi:hypothetical protein
LVALTILTVAARRVGLAVEEVREVEKLANVAALVLAQFSRNNSRS